MERILDRVNGPADLRRLSLVQLEQLAAEVREELVRTVSQTGGHLASNLGVVELTLAMHALFDSPRDKFVFDVSHQAYIHKLVTGRRDQFGTIRQLGGLAGYTAREESEHDPFGAAHAGTSISAALGMAVARDLAGEDYHVIAMIGDGALTCGMAYEAINQAGSLATPLIVILNDNEMSISPNVGAIANAMGRFRLNRRYLRAKQEVEDHLLKLPLGGEALDVAKRLKHAVKAFVLPKMVWEELGFTYIGPIDGHDLRQVMGALELAKEYTARPTLIHALTVKGKGHEAAEADCIKYHGVSPAGGAKAAAPNYSKVFADAVTELMDQDPRVVAVTAAMLEGTGLVSTHRAHPSRVFDVGISEQHAVTFAGGLATQGMRPVVAIYSTFLQRGYDQIVHDICIQNLPVVFAMDRAGVVGDDGKTHMGAFDIAYLRTLPNMIVSAPKDEAELRHLLYTAIQTDQPFAVRYPRGAGVGVPLDEELRLIPVGKGELLRFGADLGIIAFGNTVAAAQEAAERLAAQGIQASVVNARFAKPLDTELILELAERTRRLITVEEHALQGGFGSAVLELLAERRLTGVQVECLGLSDEFVEHGSQAHQRMVYDLDADGISRRALACFDWAAAGLLPSTATG